MVRLGKLIRRRRQRLCLSQEQVAARTGIFTTYLANLEAGRPTNPPSGVLLERLARALGLNRLTLAAVTAVTGRSTARPGGVGEVLSAGRAVPVINSVAAGYPRNFTDLDYPPHVADDYVRCPDAGDPQAFAARVVGDSMAPAFRQGDIVVFSPNTPARDGQACFVRFADTGETTFKAVYREDDATLRLQPLNPAHTPQRVDSDEINGLYPAIFRIQRLT